MFTVVATEPGVPGVSALQHVTMVPNIAHDHMIADNLMILKLFSVAPLVFTLPGPIGQHALYAMASKMNSFYLLDLDSRVALAKVKSKKRLVVHHDVHTGQSGVAGQHAAHHVAVDSLNELENAWDQMNSAHLSLVSLLKPVPVMADVDATSSHNGHHAAQPVALDNKLVLSPIPAQMKSDMNHRCAQIMQDFMVPGHHGQHAVQHVVVASKQDQNNIHVAVKTMFKNEPVTKMPVITNNGVNGVIVLFHVVVEMLSVNVFTVALAKFKPIPNSVTPIHAVIMVPGPIGHHAVPHVVSELCLE